MIISTLLVLSTLIHAEPIPKVDAEGTILLVKSSPQPQELILMKSGGTILKRFEPKSLDGRINSVRLNPSATKAIVVCTKPNQLLARGRGARNWPHHNIFLLDLQKTDQHAQLICEDLVSANRIAWLPNDKGIILSDLDEKEANALKNGELIPNRSWTYDFESGKKQLLKLPNGHVVFDISSDGKTLLTSTFFMISNSGDYSKSRVYLAPLDTLKPEMIVDSGFFGVRLSPDGNWVLVQKSIKRENSLGYDTTHQIMNLKTKKVHPLQPPEQALTLFEKMTFANNGKSVAFIWNEKIIEPEDGQTTYRYNLSISNLFDESPKHKLIFQSKPKEYFTLFDWR